MGRRRDHGQCPAEYLLHLRRLDGFLKHHGLLRTAQTLEMESRVLFEATHLQMLVRQGKWSEADRYLRCFSSLWKDGDGATAAPYTTLLSSLNFNAVLAWIACRGEEGGRAAASFKPPHDTFRKANPEAAKRKDIYCSMTSKEARESVNWEDIKLGTIEEMQELLRLPPNLELVPSNPLPQHMPMPQDIIPLGLRGSRRYRRKKIGHKPAHDLAYFLINKRLPPSKKIKHSGVKSPRCDHAGYTQHGQQNIDSGENTKKARPTGEFDEHMRENDSIGGDIKEGITG